MLPKHVLKALKTLNAKKGVYNKKDLIKLYNDSTNNSLEAKTKHLVSFKILYNYVKNTNKPIEYNEDANLDNFFEFEFLENIVEENTIIEDHIKASNNIFKKISDVLSFSDRPLYLKRLKKDILELIDITECLRKTTKDEYYKNALNNLYKKYNNYLKITEAFLKIFYKETTNN